MREIKFRFWDVLHKKIEYDFPVPLNEHSINRFMMMAYNSNFWKIMQSTGVKDINGVEIYEDDAVKVFFFIEEEYHIGKIIYDSGLGCYWVSDEKKFAFPLHGVGQGETLEVIGNVHENPELLSAHSL